MAIEFETPQLPPAPTSAALFGAISPLWGFYAGAALSGMTFWWMSRLARPQNLEALFGRMQAWPHAAEAVDAALDAAPPVGGEAAPFTPVVGAAAAEDVVADLAADPAPGPAELAAPAVEPAMAALTPEPLTSDVLAVDTPPAEPRSVKPKLKPLADDNAKPV